MKTVYILGAGFSKDAGAPLQNKIIEEIFNKKNHLNSHHFDRFEEFLTNQLCFSAEQHNSVNLEDIFTPLDKCLAENISFRGLSLQEISDVRDAVFYLISKTLDIILAGDRKGDGYIDVFAKYLFECSKRRMGRFRDSDPVSVISTNWDILLDNAIHSTIRDSDCPNKAVVDYCCYISSYDKDDKTIRPGLEVLGEGGFNVKLIKLHGSLNWLQCQRCMRLYVGFDRKIAMQQFEGNVSCRHCDNNFIGGGGRHGLKANLIMPTYMKNLGNPQYKIIWQNAGVEISEADKLVFIGYSLPAADFEMRQLLSRMVRDNAQIEVVTQCEEKDIPGIEKTWKGFFGRRKLTIFREGAANYIKTLVS